MTVAKYVVLCTKAIQVHTHLHQQSTAGPETRTRDLCVTSPTLYPLGHDCPQLLQYVQNSAACLITHTRKNDHITPILYHLHWLPVSLCINQKIIVTYKTLHNLGPTYFSDLLLPYVPARSLRSSSEGLLVTSRLVTMGSRAFSVVAPRLWNALPQNISHASSLLSLKTS